MYNVAKARLDVDGVNHDSNLPAAPRSASSRTSGRRQAVLDHDHHLAGKLWRWPPVPVGALAAFQRLLFGCAIAPSGSWLGVPELVCGLNQQFLAGLLAGLRTRRVDAVLQSDAAADPHRCCVLLQEATH